MLAASYRARLNTRNNMKLLPQLMMQQEATMSTLTTSFLLAICTVAVWVTPTHAQNAETTVVRLPQDIVYKGLPGAPQHVTLFGDSSQPGLYVDRIKFQPGMK